MVSKKSVTLYPWQQTALDKLHSGAILFGGVGSGKTLTALEFYIRNYSHMQLVVITTPRKRDSYDWQDEAEADGLDPEDMVVDSWNNIDKYTHMTNRFFIFDEQRVVGYGKWARSFIHIAKNHAFWNTRRHLDRLHECVHCKWILPKQD